MGDIPGPSSPRLITAEDVAARINAQPIADRNTIDERLGAARERLWEICGVVGSARRSLIEDGNDECSDGMNSLALVYSLLNKLCDNELATHELLMPPRPKLKLVVDNTEEVRP